MWRGPSCSYDFLCRLTEDVLQVPHAFARQGASSSDARGEARVCALAG